MKNDPVEKFLEVGASFDWITPFWELFKVAPALAIMALLLIIPFAVIAYHITGFVLGW